MSFCSKDPQSKYARPISYGEYSYSTNTAIIVRVDRVESIPEDSSGCGPFVNLPWWDTLGNVSFQALPELPDTTPKFLTVLCERCAGHGRLQNCKTCNGAGIIGDRHGRQKCPDCGKSLVRRCPTCENSSKKKRYGSPHGSIQCPGCKGKGERRKRMEVPYLEQPSIRTFQLGNKVFLLRSLQLMALLNELKVAPNATGPEEPMPFTFREGDGLLSPLRPAQQAEK
jgi:predicted RNA-binding Zn-ribbon protein involved in translation (DUF1610 family)